MLNKPVPVLAPFKRKKQTKSVKELLVAVGQLVKVMSDCGAICALETLKLVVINTQEFGIKQATISYNTRTVHIGTQTSTIDMSRLDNMKTEILNGPFDPLKLKDVTHVACFTLLDCFTCISANLGPQMCAKAISLFPMELLTRYKEANCLLILLKFIAMDMSIFEIYQGSDGVFEHLLFDYMKVANYNPTPQNTNTTANTTSTNSSTSEVQSSSIGQLAFYDLCCAIDEVCDVLFRAITPQQVLYIILNPTHPEEDVNLTIQEFYYSGSNTTNTAANGTATTSTATTTAVNSGNGLSNNTNNKPLTSTNNSPSKILYNQQTCCLVTPKVKALYRFLINFGRRASLDTCLDIDNNSQVADAEGPTQSIGTSTTGRDSNESWAAIIFCHMRLVAVTLCKLFTSIQLTITQMMANTDMISYMITRSHENIEFPTDIPTAYTTDCTNSNPWPSTEALNSFLSHFSQLGSWNSFKSHFLIGGSRQEEQLLILLGFKTGW